MSDINETQETVVTPVTPKPAVNRGQRFVKKVTLPEEIVKESPAEINRKKLEYMRDRDHEKIKGVFHYGECPGGKLEFFFREHKGDAIEKYELKDGEIYELPRGVVRHLKTNGWYPQYAHATDAKGNPTVKLTAKTRRFNFELYDTFLEQEDLSKEIVLVEKI